MEWLRGIWARWTRKPPKTVTDDLLAVRVALGI